jgi:hypothetical protein
VSVNRCWVNSARRHHLEDMVDGINHHPESAKSSLILMKRISSWNDLSQPRHLL